MAFDKNKILTMIKLALYDKHDGYNDRMINNYYRHDYIYGKNVSTRFAVGFCGLVIIAFYWIQIVLEQDFDIFNLDLRQMATDSILFLIALLSVFSVIGMLQGTREYYHVQKRLEKYRELVSQLDIKQKVFKKVQEELYDEEMYIQPQRARQTSNPNIERTRKTIAPPNSRAEQPIKKQEESEYEEMYSPPQRTRKTIAPPGSRAEQSITSRTRTVAPSSINDPRRQASRPSPTRAVRPPGSSTSVRIPKRNP